MYRNIRAHFVFLAVLLGLCIWLISKVPIRLGIDLQGGTELVYSLDLSRIDRNRSTVAEEVKNVIARRLDVYGLKELSVSVQGQDQLVVQLPGTQSAEDLKDQIRKTGNLVFRIVSRESENTSQTAIKQFVEQYRAYVESDKEWAQMKFTNPAYAERRPKPPELIVRSQVEKKPDANGRMRFATRPNSDTVLWNKTTYNEGTGVWDPVEQVSGSFIHSVGSTVDPQTLRPAVTFEFKGEGAAMFAELTGNHVKEPMAIVLDDDVMQIATIQNRISGSGQIVGDYTQEEVKSLISILRGGSLATKPDLISESTVGPVLGQDSIQSGLMAIAFGLGGVMLIMAIYYLAGGIVANLALALNLLFIYAFVVCFRQTLTLPGIAGMLLTLAMAVDANILIFERFREEKKKGKNLQQSLAAGYDRAFWVIFDSNLTTIITGYVLFYMGTGPVKGFAITLITGLFASFFTSVYVTRVIFSFLCKYGILKEMKMLEAFPTPRIPFTLYQRPFILGSAILIAVTWICVIFRGKDNYGIDFTGGARVVMNLTAPVKVEDMRQKVGILEHENPELFRDYSLQTLQATKEGLSRSYALLTRAGSASPSKTAKAQEKAPEKAEGAAPPALPAPAQPAPAPPAAAPATDLAPGAKAEEVHEEEPAQRVRAVLEKLLSKEGLLVPPPFPVERWDAGTVPGSQALTVEVNLAMVREDVTTEVLKAELNAFLAKNKYLTTENRGTGLDDYKGLTVDSVALVGKPVEGDATKVTRYSVKTTAYREPLPGTTVDAGIPTHAQVRDSVQAFFKTGAPKGMLQISDPFPQVSTVGPRVASGLQADALVAVFISIVGIVFYLALRFEFIYGLAGVIALVHDCMVAIGVMSVTDLLLPTTFPVKLNLNELAAVLTIIGFSINDTIVLFDRIRENKDLLARKKLTLKDLVDISVNQTLARTLWTSTTVLLVDVILLGFGGDSVRGFAYLFAVGTVAGVYSSVFIAAPIAIWLFDRAEARRKLMATQPVA